MLALVKRLSKSMPKELPWRVDVIIGVSCLAIVVMVHEEMYDLFGLSMVSAIVIAIGFLLYFPRLGLWIIGGAGCLFLSQGADRIQHWQPLLPLIFIMFILVFGLVYHDDHIILQQLAPQDRWPTGENRRVTKSFR